MIPTSSRMTDTLTPCSLHDDDVTTTWSGDVIVTSHDVVSRPLVVVESVCGVCDGSNGLPGAQTDATASDRHVASAVNAMIPVRSRPRRRRRRVKRNVPRIPVAPARPIHTPTTSSLTPLEYMYPTHQQTDEQCHQ